MKLPAVALYLLLFPYAGSEVIPSLPAILYTGGSRNVVEGSVIWLHCEVGTQALANSVKWMKDDIEVIQDIPHIRMRAGSFFLVVDNFQASDAGTYQCATLLDGEETGVVGSTFNLTASSLMSGSLREISRDVGGASVPFFLNRTAFLEGAKATLSYTVGHVGDDVNSYPAPSVLWLKDGVPARATPNNNNLTENGRLLTTLSFTFTESDAGIYQCVFTDPVTSDVLISIPIRLDTGTELTFEPISSPLTVVQPPDKLVLEVRTAGGFSTIHWTRNEVIQGFPGFQVPLDAFVHFGEIYVAGRTSLEDLGMYIVVMTPSRGQRIPNPIILNVANATIAAPVLIASVSPPSPVMRGTLSTLKCEVVDGDPPNQLFWLDPGGVLLVFSSTATVTFNSDREYGTYTCHARNLGGSATATVEVVQATAPSVELSDGQISAPRVKPGDNVKLTVLISAFNLLLTSIIWRKQGDVLTGTEDQVAIMNNATLPATTGPVLSTLLLRAVLPEDSGNYTVSAANEAGNNTVMFILTVEDFQRPDAPVNVSFLSIGARWVMLSWKIVFDGNAPIVGAVLFTNKVASNLTIESNISSSSLMIMGSAVQLNVSEVTPFTNYAFTVMICNKVGCSEASLESDVILTQQDTSSPPINATITAKTLNTFTLQWQPPLYPNGVISSYLVSYVGMQSYDPSFSESGTVIVQSPGEENSGGMAEGVVVPRLTPGTVYTVTVAAINGARRAGGVGEKSAAVTVLTDSRAYFQLRLMEVRDCVEWTSDDGEGKAIAVVQEVVTQLKLRCKCIIEANQISSAGFRCFLLSPEAVTFRALISGSPQVAAPELIRILEDWISTPDVVISVQAQILSIDEHCNVTISSLGEQECHFSSPTSNYIAILGGSVAAISVFIAIVIAAIFIVILVIMKHRAKSVVIEQATMPQDYEVPVRLTDMARSILEDHSQSIPSTPYPPPAQYEVPHIYELINDDGDYTEIEPIRKEKTDEKWKPDHEPDYYNSNDNIERDLRLVGIQVIDCPAYGTTLDCKAEIADDNSFSEYINV